MYLYRFPTTDPRKGGTMTRYEPSPEAMDAATKYIDKQIQNAVDHGGMEPSRLDRELAIYGVAQITEKWIRMLAAYDA
jgi:N-acetylglucosamine kinase-like BadF-type ATPase